MFSSAASHIVTKYNLPTPTGKPSKDTTKKKLVSIGMDSVSSKNISGIQGNIISKSYKNSVNKTSTSKNKYVPSSTSVNLFKVKKTSNPYKTIPRTVTEFKQREKERKEFEATVKYILNSKTCPIR